MAVPIAEQIAAKVRLRLLNIDEDSGYETTAENVIRPARINRNTPRDYQIIVTQGVVERNEELSCPGNPPATCWNLPVFVSGQLRQSDRSTEAIDNLRNEFYSDCIKAICQPQASWHQWDGLAIDTRIGSIEDVINEDSAGFKLDMIIMFRTDEGNPYNFRA